MRVLAIDTSSQICSVALLEDRKIIEQLHTDEVHEHSQTLMPLLKNMMDKQQLQVKDVDLLGNVEVSKGIVSLQSDKGTSYEMYIAVQDQLAAAYNDVRDRKAVSKWGKKYSALTSEQQDAIKNWVPMSISEAEPKNIGGKK